VDSSTGRFFFATFAPHTMTTTSAESNRVSLAPLPDFIEQRYDVYESESHDVWRILYERRMDALRDTASDVFLRGIDRIGLAPDRVPELADVNGRLAARTAWRAVGVGGFIPAAQFFSCLARRHFPTTLIVRPRAQLDYLPEPDIFHDVFGHVPLHSDPVFASFLGEFGALAAEAHSEEETTAMARLFWFTVEFGLVREGGQVRIYGSGLISSHADAANALGPACDRRPFDLDAVLAQPFLIDHVQDTLFVLESFEQLFDAVTTLRRRRSP
jgi:phenylalanine-4-hydroxylase